MITDHVAAARKLLHSGTRLNAWELGFCTSMLDVRWPTPKQLSALATLIFKVHAKKPRRVRRRR